MNLNEQIQQAYEAGRRQGLNEQMDMMPVTPYSAPNVLPWYPPATPGGVGPIQRPKYPSWRQIIDRQGRRLGQWWRENP